MFWWRHKFVLTKSANRNLQVSTGKLRRIPKNLVLKRRIPKHPPRHSDSEDSIRESWRVWRILTNLQVTVGALNLEWAIPNHLPDVSIQSNYPMDAGQSWILPANPGESQAISAGPERRHRHSRVNKWRIHRRIASWSPDCYLVSLGLGGWCFLLPSPLLPFLLLVLCFLLLFHHHHLRPSTSSSSSSSSSSCCSDYLFKENFDSRLGSHLLLFPLFRICFSACRCLFSSSFFLFSSVSFSLSFLLSLDPSFLPSSLPSFHRSFLLVLLPCCYSLSFCCCCCGFFSMKKEKEKRVIRRYGSFLIAANKRRWHRTVLGWNKKEKGTKRKKKSQNK